MRAQAGSYNLNTLLRASEASHHRILCPYLLVFTSPPPPLYHLFTHTKLTATNTTGTTLTSSPNPA